MEYHLCILLYSKFSASSKQIFSIIDSYPNFSSIIGLSTLCIDNEEIRQRLYKSTKLSISTVPCLLLVYKTGAVEKYEGKQSFQWIEENIKKYFASGMQPGMAQPGMAQPMVQPGMVQPNIQNIQPTVQNRGNVIRKPGTVIQQHNESNDVYTLDPNHDFETDTDLIESVEPVRNKRPSTNRNSRVQSSSKQKQSNNPKQVKQIKKKSKHQPIEELENLDSDSNHSNLENSDSESSETIKRPPVAIRSGEGKYDIMDNFGEPEVQNRNVTNRTRKTKQSVKGDDIMSAAAAMQKERESTMSVDGPRRLQN